MTGSVQPRACGGVLRDIEATYGSLSLDEVMRFRDAQQGAASLAMRAA